MNRMRMVGLALTALALCGYVIGVVAPYPGRSLTVTGVMVGIALAVMSDPRPPSVRTREPNRDTRRFDGGGSTDGRDALGSSSVSDGADVRAGAGGDRA